MTTTLYSVFQDINNAERAGGALLDYGVKPEDLSIVRKHEGEVPAHWTRPDAAATQGSLGAVPSTGVSNAAYGDRPVTGSDRFGADAVGVHEETARVNDDDYDTLNTAESSGDAADAAKSGITTTTAADAGKGAVVGTEIGVGVGIAAALVSIFVPGFGLLAGGGALAAALGGVAATAGAGAITGAVTGFLKDQGMDEPVAREYEAAVGEGGALVAVQVPSGNVDEQTVRSILDKYGATQVTNQNSRYMK